MIKKIYKNGKRFREKSFLKFIDSKEVEHYGQISK